MRLCRSGRWLTSTGSTGAPCGWRWRTRARRRARVHQPRAGRPPGGGGRPELCRDGLPRSPGRARVGPPRPIRPGARHGDAPTNPADRRAAFVEVARQVSRPGGRVLPASAGAGSRVLSEFDDAGRQELIAALGARSVSVGRATVVVRTRSGLGAVPGAGSGAEGDEGLDFGDGDLGGGGQVLGGQCGAGRIEGGEPGRGPGPGRGQRRGR